MTRFLLGLGLGTVIGALVAPAPGEETRRQLRQKAEELRDEKLGEVIQMGREKAGEMAREASERTFDNAARKVAGEGAVRKSHESA